MFKSRRLSDPSKCSDCHLQVNLRPDIAYEPDLTIYQKEGLRLAVFCCYVYVLSYVTV